jgi:hypothetical protein
LQYCGALLGFAFVLHASYPGYLNPDSVSQLKQVMNGAYDDWQSPFLKLLWSVLVKLIPGPVGFIVLNNVLIWGAILALALAMRRFIGAWSILLVAVPFFPGVFNFLGNVHVDAMLAAWLLAAASTAYISRRENVSERMRLVLQILANLFIIAAFLTRLNVIFSLVPLLLYANARLGLRRNLLLCLALIVAMPVLNMLQNKILEVTPLSAADSIKVYNLLALSYYERRNLFPGEWTESQSRDIVNACYSPVQWDTAWTGQCGFIYAELQRQQLWGSPQLTRAWLREIFGHRGAYFSMLAATFKKACSSEFQRHALQHAEPLELASGRQSSASFNLHCTALYWFQIQSGPAGPWSTCCSPPEHRAAVQDAPSQPRKGGLHSSS